MKVALFSKLSAENISELGKLMRPRRLKKGQLLFSEGDPCAGLYIVAHGRMRIYKTSASGREQVLAVETVGGSIAELPVFDGGPYPASVSALENSTVLFVSSSDFRAFCLKYPEVSLNLLSVVGARLRQLVSTIEELSFATILQRLAAVLLRTAGERNHPIVPGTTFELGRTHRDIANEMGTVRELVSRNLLRIQQDGLVRIEGQRITILDPTRLQAVAAWKT